MSKIFSLYIKSTQQHHDYTTLSGIFKDRHEVGVSKGKLDRYDWSQPFDNDYCTIRRGEVKKTKRPRTNKNEI